MRFTTLEEALEHHGDSKVLEIINRALLEQQGLQRQRERARRVAMLLPGDPVEFSLPLSLRGQREYQTFDFCRPYLREGTTGVVESVDEFDVVRVKFEGSSDRDMVSRELLLLTET